MTEPRAGGKIVTVDSAICWPACTTYCITATFRFSVEGGDALVDQLVGVELDLVDGLVVDSAPELLELLLVEVLLVERDALRLAAVAGRGMSR